MSFSQFVAKRWKLGRLISEHRIQKNFDIFTNFLLLDMHGLHWKLCLNPPKPSPPTFWDPRLHPPKVYGSGNDVLQCLAAGIKTNSKSDFKFWGQFLKYWLASGPARTHKSPFASTCVSEKLPVVLHQEKVVSGLASAGKSAWIGEWSLGLDLKFAMSMSDKKSLFYPWRSDLTDSVIAQFSFRHTIQFSSCHHLLWRKSDFRLQKFLWPLANNLPFRHSSKDVFWTAQDRITQHNLEKHCSHRNYLIKNLIFSGLKWSMTICKWLAKGPQPSQIFTCECCKTTCNF